MLKKDDPNQQLVYYQVRHPLFNRPILEISNDSVFQAGIGTYTIPQIAKPMMAKLHKLMDSMVGVHLDAHVMG